MSIVYLGKATPASGSGGGSGNAVWGAITGTLSDQTDLQDALNAKQNTLTAGSGITISNGTISAIGVESVANQNTAVGAISPLKVWNGTEAEWNTGGGSQTWYNWIANGNQLESYSGMPQVSSQSYYQYPQFIEYLNNQYIAYNPYGGFNVSSDGKTWTNIPYNLGSAQILGIEYGASKYIVSTNNNKLQYSTDLTNWTDIVLNDASYHYSILTNAVFYDNKFWVAAKAQDVEEMYEAKNVILSSSDGISWTPADISINLQNHKLLVINNTLFAHLKTNSSNFYYSSNGTTWSQGSSTNSFSVESMTYGDGKYIFGRHYSTDLVNWIQIDINISGSITYANGYFVSCSGSKNVGQAYGFRYYNISTDGVNWTQTEVGTNDVLGDVAYGSAGFVFCGGANSYILSIGTTLNAYTTDAEPTTASTVYSAPSVTSALTITSVGTGTITLSDTNTYDYNASGNQTTTSSVGLAHPDYLCNIDGVGVKIGTTDVANLASYSAFTGATSQTAGSAGLVPAPTTGDVDKYLKGDGTWGAVSGVQNNATGSHSWAIGANAEANGADSIVIGDGATTQNFINSIALGREATVDANSCLAIGYNAYNDTPNTLVVGLGEWNATDQVWDCYTLLGAGGKIPNDRLSIDGTSITINGSGQLQASGSGSSGLQNTATGTDSLTILGTPSTYDKTINIGTHSSADGDGAIALGDGQASYSGSIAIGYDPDQGIFADGQDAIAIGTEAHANNLKSIAIGPYAHANYDYSIALGNSAETSDMEFAIGFGYDQNTSTYRNYVLLDGTTGKIPNDRINGATGSFTSQDGKTVTVTNGVITSIV